MKLQCESLWIEQTRRQQPRRLELEQAEQAKTQHLLAVHSGHADGV